MGSAAVGAQTSNGRVDAVVIEDAVRQRGTGRVRSYSPRAASPLGARARPSETVREPVLGLPVAGVPADAPARRPLSRFPHPALHAGLAVDEAAARRSDGRPVYENVYAAGAMLAGAEPWREKSGDGISVASGFRAAEAIERRLARDLLPVNPASAGVPRRQRVEPAPPAGADAAGGARVPRAPVAVRGRRAQYEQTGPRAPPARSAVGPRPRARRGARGAPRRSITASSARSANPTARSPPPRRCFPGRSTLARNSSGFARTAIRRTSRSTTARAAASAQGLPPGGEDRRDQLTGARDAQGGARVPAARPSAGEAVRLRPPGVAGRAAANLSFRLRPSGALMERTLGIHRDAPFPPVVFAGKTFQRWARRRPRWRQQDGCLLPRLLDELVRAPNRPPGRRAARARGLSGGRAPQDCCGLPLSRTECSRLRDAMPSAWHGRSPRLRARGLDIVATSTSCSLMLKREAREILDLEDDPDAPSGLRADPHDICEWLRDRLDGGDLPDDFRPVPLTVPYHAPCQQRGHGIGRPALDLLALVPGSRWTISTRTAAA